MSDQTTLTVRQTDPLAIMPIMDIQAAAARRQAIVDFTSSLMKLGTHYGRVPGTDKDTLFKPGAEMLTTFFGLSPRFEVIEKTEDWTGQGYDGEPFFFYRYRCALYRGDMLVGEGIGSCNSWEKKYRWRTADLVCPSCGKAEIRLSKYPPRNDPSAPPGWYCYAKAGGCGAEYARNDQRISDQPRGQIPNPNPADLVNTIDKMAQKRALVAATLIAVNASEFFTQDVEDMDYGDIIDGEYAPVTEAKPDKRSAKRKAGKKKPPERVEFDDLEPAKKNGNGGNHEVDLESDTPPSSLKNFAVWYAHRHPYYRDNRHVVGALTKEIYDSGFGVSFSSHDINEVMDKLDAFANENADQD